MMICGSCAMRIDGATVLACKLPMKKFADAGKVPVISAMGNMPIVKDLVVDMDPFWAKFRSVEPVPPARLHVPPAGREHVISPKRMAAIHKESLCINCGACVSECNAMESSPDFLGPQALAKAMRFVGDPRDGAKNSRLEELNGQHGIWECTRCYFCNERCPKGVDPRDAIAKLGAESIKEGIDRDMGAKHAKWFVTSAKTTGWLRETELVPKTQGIVESIKQTKFALGLAKQRQGAAAVPAARREGRARVAAAARPAARAGRARLRGHRPGRARRSRSSRTATTRSARDPYGPGSFPKPLPRRVRRGRV